MGKFSVKNKIVLIIVAWLMLSCVMFFYLFSILDASNNNSLLAMDQQNKELAVLNAERDSYNNAKADLDKISKEQISPDSFFSKDVALVNEIKTLESWAQKLNVQMQLSGVSGTINTLPKAKTATSIGTVPYSVNLVGSFTDIVNFIEVLENLNFITNINTLSISALDKGQVSLNLSAFFYLRK